MLKRKNVSNLKADPDEKIQWKKVGGGSFHFNRKIIKPGQVFMASLNEIPEQFRDVIVPVDGAPLIQTKVVPGVVPIFTKVANTDERDEDDDDEYFDVVNAKGKKLNDKPLTEDKADKFIKLLSE